MPDVNDQNWNKQVIALGGHFYQSSHWGEFQEALGYKTRRDHGDGWLWQAAVRVGRGGISYLYCPYGPIVTSHEALTASLSALIAVGKETRADFVKAEPWGTAAMAAGWQAVPDMQPKHIMRLDITPSEDDLRKNISQSNRNLINTAKQRGLRFRVSNDAADLETFIKLQHGTAKRGGFKPHADDYYRKLMAALPGIARIYAAEFEGQPVAMAIGFDFGEVRYYAHAATDDERNREHKGAIALLWWLIADAKAQGIKTFDFGGVAPADQPNHPWAGHTRFKQSVGGEIITLGGTWDYPIKPAKYKLYRAAKKVLPL